VKVLSRTVLATLLVLTAMMASETALAHRGRTSIGIGFGFGFPGWYPGWYAPGPYYYPTAYPYYDPYYYPAYGYPAAPMTYVEQGAQPASPQPEAQWWYYCAQAQAYYPYVRECAGGWQRVAPRPPGG
jgi:hypothetical protein